MSKQDWHTGDIVDFVTDLKTLKKNFDASLQNELTPFGKPGYIAVMRTELLPKREVSSSVSGRKRSL